jgi:hypothetical protein
MAMHSKPGSQATVVEVATRTFALPMDCPCCGSTPDSELLIGLARTARDRVAADSAKAVEVPYCRVCIEHATMWESAGVMSAGLGVIGIAAGAIIAAVSSGVVGGAVIVAGLLVGIALAAARRAQARHACRESCSCPQRAVGYLGWTGSATGFSFESKSYAAKFAEQNPGKLVEDPRVRTLLERYKLARIAVPTPAAAVQAIPPPPDAAEWMARLASESSRVARRAALTRALDVLTEPKERDQVIRSVAAIELAALMAPIEKLHGDLRKRALDLASAHVRADNLPDELRAALLRDLETKR